MNKAITRDIEVDVETFYQDVDSEQSGRYIFAYRITITNHGEATVKLLRRHWYIIESDGNKSEVEGEGVIGRQPVIEPGQSHQYVSGCHLETPRGKMFGNYLMEKIADGTTFEVLIPEFIMETPFVLN